MTKHNDTIPDLVRALQVLPHGTRIKSNNNGGAMQLVTPDRDRDDNRAVFQLAGQGATLRFIASGPTADFSARDMRLLQRLNRALRPGQGPRS